MKFPFVGTSRSVLLLLSLWLLVAAGAGYSLRDWLHLLYFENQLTLTGLTVNGAIVGLFAIGVLKLVFILNFYRLQETAVRRVFRNLVSKEKNPLHGVSDQSLVASRYKAMEALQYKNLLAIHPGMALSTANTESTRMGLARFINNILILVGVFGTVVSLSLSLVGASDLLIGLGSDASGVNNIIHGMSTALSTTISAIFCYLFFGYFYLSTLHVQSRFLCQFEGLISQHLLPRLAIDQEALPIELYGLIKGLRESSHALESHHQAFDSMFGQLVELSNRLNDRIERGSNAITELVGQIRQFPDLRLSLEEMRASSERNAVSSENIGNLIGSRLVGETQAASARLESAVQQVAETVGRQGSETRELQTRIAEKNLAEISQGLKSLRLAENLQSMGSRLEQLVGALAERVGKESGETRDQSARHAQQSLAAIESLDERIGREGSETRNLQKQHTESGRAFLQGVLQPLAVGEQLENLAARIETGLASLNELITREGSRQQNEAVNAFAQIQNLLERLGSTLASVGERVSREAEQGRNQQQSIAETGRAFLNQELGGIELSGPLTEAVGRIEQALTALGQQLAKEEDETRRHLGQNMQTLETILRENVKAVLEKIVNRD